MGSGLSIHEENFKNVSNDAFALFRRKNAGYGTANIARAGYEGVVIRMRDKFARIESGNELPDEKTEDTLLDLANYAMMAVMIRRNLWPGCVFLPSGRHMVDLNRIEPTQDIGHDKLRVLVSGMDGIKKPAKPGDVGYDLAASEETTIPARNGKPVYVPTGVRVKCPDGVWARVAGRSSTMRSGMIVTDGTIDCGYTGELLIGIFNMTDEPIIVAKGRVLAQLIFQTCVTPKIMFVEELPATMRGDTGFGSTGQVVGDRPFSFQDDAPSPNLERFRNIAMPDCLIQSCTGTTLVPESFEKNGVDLSDYGDTVPPSSDDENTISVRMQDLVRLAECGSEEKRHDMLDELIGKEPTIEAARAYQNELEATARLLHDDGSVLLTIDESAWLDKFNVAGGIPPRGTAKRAYFVYGLLTGGKSAFSNQPLPHLSQCNEMIIAAWVVTAFDQLDLPSSTKIYALDRFIERNLALLHTKLDDSFVSMIKRVARLMTTFEKELQSGLITVQKNSA